MADPRQQPPGGSAAAEPRPLTTLGFAAAATVVGLIARLWLRAHQPPLVWNDSADYIAASRTPLWSLDRLAGPRPILTPLLLSVAGRDLRRLIDLQTLSASIAWGLLAAAVAACLPGTIRRVVAAVVVVAFSLTWPISMWDQQILTESPALSALALTAAAGIWFARSRTAIHGATLVGAATLLVIARDSHAIPVALVGLGLVLVGWAGWAKPRQTVALTGAYLVAMSFLVVGMAQHGRREVLPTEHVFEVRVLPYPERVAWFSAHGMPDGPSLDAIPEYTLVDRAPYTPAETNPLFGRWRAWVAAHGRSALVAYVATHPGYLWSEPRHHPERVFNNGDGVAGYRPLITNELPGLAPVLYPSIAIVVAVGLASLILLATLLRASWGPTSLVGLLLAATAAPHALVVWHSDGMESARHLLIPSVQLRLGVLLLALSLLRGTGRSRPVRSPDHQPAPARPGD